MESQSESTQTLSAVKRPMLKTGDYDLWSMRMEQYLTHTDYALWEVIMNRDAPAVASAIAEGLIPPKTVEQNLARKNELKAKSILLLAIPNEHMLKFHGIKDAKSLWEAIKNRFGGNKESKKMQKTILKQNYENFAASSQEELDKVYDSPQLDNEDLEQIDTNDLEEMDLKSHVAMLTIRMKRFIKKTRRNLNFNGKETVGFDKIKVECYNCQMRGHFARECRVLRNYRNRNRDNTRRVVQVETPANALVFQDGIGGYDWSFQAEEDHTNFALMAYTSQGSSSSEFEVHTCSKDCLKSYETLQKYYDQQREALNKSNLEIIGYQIGLESLEARIVVHEKNEAKDKTGLGYDSHVNESVVLDNVVDSAFDSHESDGDNNQVNDRFKKNDSVYKSKVSKTISSKDSLDTTASETSKESLEKPKTVRPSAPIIEDWKSDIDDDFRRTFTQKAAPKNSILKGKVNTAKVNNVTTAGPKAVVSAAEGNGENAGNPQYTLQDQGIFDSGCSRHMTGNKFYLSDYQDIDGGFVAFA
ncbi:ribonuclease H-like domain-containing protein [Tanacetum coccineum]